MNIEECINFLLTGAQHRVFIKMKKSLKELGLTPIQYGVLKCIWQFDMSNPKEIAEFLGVENSTVSGILDRMEGKGLLEREIDVNDRRHIIIRLSDSAKELEKSVDRIVLEVNQKVLEDFSEEEIVQFKQYLRRVKVAKI
ncbi:MAG: MarR family transcriptional regulator [Firmicutes bacterium]|nr:MarR family transcriptional regulator [Bacillota bacterium]NBI63351.1 MarR family transcriptional regulator [Clostridiales bacterium]